MFNITSPKMKQISQTKMAVFSHKGRISAPSVNRLLPLTLFMFLINPVCFLVVCTFQRPVASQSNMRLQEMGDQVVFKISFCGSEC